MEDKASPRDWNVHLLSRLPHYAVSYTTFRSHTTRRPCSTRCEDPFSSSWRNLDPHGCKPDTTPGCLGTVESSGLLQIMPVWNARRACDGELSLDSGSHTTTSRHRRKRGVGSVLQLHCYAFLHRRGLVEPSEDIRPLLVSCWSLTMRHITHRQVE